MKTKNILSEVKNWIENAGYDSEKQALEDLQRCGCVSGLVGGMIYYSDTVEFYKSHKKEIISLVEDFCLNCGESLQDFLTHANNFPLDKEELSHESFVTGIDGLIRKNRDIEDQIKNWFAWFGFEEVAYQYYCEKYEN